MDSKEVRAERFVLVDPSGRERAVIEIDDKAPTLLLFDKQGRARIGLATGEQSGSGLVIFDEDGKKRAQVGLTSAGEAALNLGDAANPQRISLLAGPDGNPVVTISGAKALVTIAGPNAESSARLAFVEGQGPGLTLSDESGAIRAALVISQGRPMLRLSGPDENSSANLIIGSDGAFLLSFSDKSETPRIILSGSCDNTASLVIHDKYGELRAGLAVEPDGYPRLILRSVDAAESRDSIHNTTPTTLRDEILRQRRQREAHSKGQREHSEQFAQATEKLFVQIEEWLRDLANEGLLHVEHEPPDSTRGSAGAMLIREGDHNEIQIFRIDDSNNRPWAQETVSSLGRLDMMNLGVKRVASDSYALLWVGGCGAASEWRIIRVIKAGPDRWRTAAEKGSVLSRESFSEALRALLSE